jgi:hypothetical protein
VWLTCLTWFPVVRRGLVSEALEDTRVVLERRARPVCRRGLPARRRGTFFFSSYLSTLIERDVLEVSSIERQGDMLRLLSLLAGRVGGLLVPGTLAGQTGIPRITLVRYRDRLSPHRPGRGPARRAGRVPPGQSWRTSSSWSWRGS